MASSTTDNMTEIILKASEKAKNEIPSSSKLEYTDPIKWPVECTIGPGLEGAIACESKIGYVNGSKGALVYRGFDIFDLCAHSTFEEVSYLLINGKLPNASELNGFQQKIFAYRHVPRTLRYLMNFPVEKMNSMAALRIGMNMMRHEFTYQDLERGKPAPENAISSDEDSIPMETKPKGEKKAIYEFKNPKTFKKSDKRISSLDSGSERESCYHLLAGVATITAAVARLRFGKLPIEPHPTLGYAANLLYMIKGKIPTPEEARLMDIALILHADHGMNASTFASLVVGSTLSDFYFSIGAGIAALNGPLHGGANEQVLNMLEKIKSPDNVQKWFEKARREKQKIMGFGHRVYKAYDPRARVLGPLAKYLIKSHPEYQELFKTATELEKIVISTLGAEKKIFPNVDFYSGIVYTCMGIPTALFTPIFAVSRTAGWTARLLEYHQKNRIFRPRAMYIGDFDSKYVPIEER